MKVLILASGKSSRLQPISDKNLLNFCGKTVLEHQIKSLIQVGFRDLIISTNKENKEKISNLSNFLTKKNKNLKINIVEQKDLSTGQAGGVLAAEKKLGNSPVLIISGNDVVDPSLFKDIFKKSKTEKSVLVTGLKTKEYFPGGYLKLKGDKILQVIEKPGENNIPSNFINIVVHFFPKIKDFLVVLKQYTNKKEGGYENALSDFLKKENVKILRYTGFWQAIKFPWHILDLNQFFLSNTKVNKISKNSRIHPSSIVENSIISDGVDIKENSIVKNSFIGKNSVVSNFSLVRNSNIGENCVVGSFTEIARSFFSDNIWTHYNYIGDSVVGENTSFGAGSKTANLRLDEGNIFVDIKGEKINTNSNKIGVFCGKNIRVGAGVYFSPGVKIGSNSFINSNLVVKKDLKKNSFLKSEKNIVENKKQVPKKRG